VYVSSFREYSFVTLSKFVSEISNSFRLTKLMYGSVFFMKEIISSFFSGSSGISSPVFCLPKINEASDIFFISSCIRISSGLVRKEGWNLTSSMFSCNFSSVGLFTRGSGRYTWMWKDFLKWDFRALAAESVRSRYAIGSPPVIPAPRAFESVAS